MSKKVIFAEQLIAEAVKVASLHPEFVYNSDLGCCYADPEVDKPSCLWGHALFNLGVTIDELRQLDAQEDIESTIGTIALEQYDRYCIIISANEEQAAAMMQSQIAQDNDVTWGRAIVPLLDFIKPTP